MATSDIRDAVKARYGRIAERKSNSASCCGPKVEETISQAVGYGKEDLEAVPDGANLGLGCGNPVALASLRAGDTVLDLGSGAGFDCFLAAKKVGETGRVIGVDMTPSMLAKARANAQRGGYTNVEFREGHIEKLPVDDNSIDVVISNCVINLSPDKEAVFSEIHRVLKPGGRFFISDLVLTRALPESITRSEDLYCACVAGALLKSDYLAAMKVAGFNDIRVAKEARYPMDLFEGDERARKIVESNPDITREDIRSAGESVMSVQVEGTKGFGVTGQACCGGCC
jgi:SAM-dependent methyltransferase